MICVDGIPPNKAQETAKKAETLAFQMWYRPFLQNQNFRFIAEAQLEPGIQKQ